MIRWGSVTFADSLHAWHDFFLLAGGGAATLLGLVFIAVSLVTGMPSLPRERDEQLFVAPILSQFGYAFALAAMNLAPWQDMRRYGACVTVMGASAFIQSAWLLRGMQNHHRRRARVHVRVWLWNGLFPFVASLTVAASGFLSWRTPHLAVGGVAVATLMLDLIGVRNTWRLVLWIIGARLPDEASKPS